MMFGAGSYTYPWWIEQQTGHVQPMELLKLLADRVKALGVGVIQLCDNSPLDRLGQREWERLGAYCHSKGLVLEIGTRGIGREHLRDFLQKAQWCGATLIRTMLPDLYGKEPTVAEAIEELQGIRQDCESKGIIIAIENHDRKSTLDLVRIVEAVGGGKIGICVDTVNSFAALEPPDLVLENLLPYAKCIHIKDFDIVRTNHQMGFSVEGRPAGMGRLKIPELLRRAGEQSIILELWTPAQKNLTETVRLETDWAEKSIKTLLAKEKEWVQ